MQLSNILTGAVLACVSGVNAFTKVTAEQAWSAMNPGWNLGNTLDAVPDETSWGNPKADATLLDEIKASGYKSIRLPVTWTDHFATEAPDWTVNKTWMDRVEQVVDWSLDRQFWVVINVHHDSWQWADFTDTTDFDARMAKFEKLWVQIADRFKAKNERLIFESLNEPPGDDTEADAEVYNDMNQRFVNIVRGSGGFNKDRLLTLPGLKTNIADTVNWFKVPANASNYILHVHDYDPWGFVSTSWGQTFWGTASDKQTIEDTFISLQTKFAAPALIGEWGVTGKSIERGYAWNYFDFMVRTARKYNLTTQLWDNGFDHYDRVAHAWRDPVKQTILINAAKGVVNALPAYDQLSAVYIKANSTVTAVPIELTLNGNTILSVTNANGKTLKRGTEYTVSATGINVTASYLTTTALADKTTLGLKDTLTVRFNAGVNLPFDIRLYAAPTAATKSYTVDGSTDLSIPVNAGGSSLATVKALRRDGVYLKDDWTQWLGPLQQARINWGDFDVSGSNVVVYSALLQTIKASGQTVDLTLEYWPRTDAANNVTIAVTVQ
ncbi:glycoside hydrolase superfamily [Geopyxis carbonaria]|nr:glycoside hydrolase superfamily [Geopyxis carbonaria]